MHASCCSTVPFFGCSQYTAPSLRSIVGSRLSMGACGGARESPRFTQISTPSLMTVYSSMLTVFMQRECVAVVAASV